MFSSPITKFSGDVVSLLRCRPEQVRADAPLRRRADLSVYVPGPFVKVQTAGKISLEWERPASAEEETKATLQATLAPGADVPAYGYLYIAVTAGGETILIGDSFHLPKVYTKRTNQGSSAELRIEWQFTPLLVVI